MSDGATGGSAGAGSAGAATGATQGVGSAPGAPKGAPKPIAAKAPAKTDAPSWSEKDDADFIDRLKRSPYGKLKVDGKDEAIDSVDAFKRTLLDAQRGKGANRIVEQTKKEAAEAKAAKEEHAAHKALVERARRGDPQARRELGLIPDDERNAAEQEWAALPPEVKAIIQQNQELSNRLREREEAEAKTLKEREETEKKTTRDATLKRAHELSKEVLKDVKEELYDVELPEVLLAMETLKASGARFGVDYTSEQLAAYIDQQREAGVWERVGRTKPNVALKKLAPVLKGLKSGELREALGDDFPALARIFSAAWIDHHKALKAKPAATQQGSTTQEQPKKPQPLSPFKFQR